jgi:hypothetical protein
VHSVAFAQSSSIDQGFKSISFCLMEEIIREATNVLVPLLSAGVGATAGGMAEEGGARLYGGIVDRVRRLLGDRTPTVDTVAVVLDAALGTGEISTEELERFLTRERGDTTTTRDVYGKINFIGGRTTIHGNVG